LSRPLLLRASASRPLDCLLHDFPKSDVQSSFDHVGMNEVHTPEHHSDRLFARMQTLLFILDALVVRREK